MPRIVIATDNFNRGFNETPLSLPWQLASSAGTHQSFNLSSDAITPAANFAVMYRGFITWPANQYSQIKWSGTGMPNGGAAVRIDPATGSFYYLSNFTGTAYSLGKWAQGVGFVEIVSWTGTAPQAGDVIRLEVEGNRLTGYLNGSLIGSTTDNSFASGNPGIFVYPTGDVWDDWEGGEVTTFFVQEAEVSSWGTNTTPKGSGNFTTQTGDLVIAVMGNQAGSSGAADATGTNVTLSDLANIGTGGSHANARAKSGVVAAGGTTSVSFSQINNINFGGNALTFRNHAGVGAVATNTPTTIPQVAITTTAPGSAVVVIATDFAASNGASRAWLSVNGIAPSAANGLEQSYYANVGVDYGAYVAYYPDVGAAGLKTVGLSNPSSSGFSIIAIEIKSNPPVWNTTGTGPRSVAVAGAGPTGAGSSGAFTRSTASGALSATANQASEQDAAQAIAWAPKRRLANQASEQDTAQGITRRKTRAVAQASEQDAAQAVTSRKLKAVAQASESDSAQAIAVNPRRRLLAQSLEQDAAQAIASRKLKAVAQAIESDAAQTVAVNPQRRLIGQVNEQDASQAIAQRKARTLVQASEQDAAQAISSRKAKAIAQAQEQDRAQTVTGRKAATVGAAAESDAAGAITARKARTVAQASESDLAQPITPPGELVVSVAQASETDAAGAITSAKRASIGQASENDLAQTIAPPGEIIVAVGQASETDLAQSITAAKRLSLQAASEQDAAGAITARRAFAVIGAAEQDQAQPITSGVTLVGQAFEQDAANDVTVAGVAPPAPVTQEPLGGYPIRGKSGRRRRAPPSVQPDLFELPPEPPPIRPAITKALAAASESDEAQPITVLHFPIGPVIAARRRARLIAEDDLLLMLCA